MVVFDGIPNIPESPSGAFVLSKDQTIKSTKSFVTKKSETTGLSTYSGKSNSTTQSVIDEHVKGVTMGKWTFVFFLMVIAGFLGFISYYLLEMAEQNLWKEQYESMTHENH